MHQTTPRPFSGQARRGVALVIVLAFLVLLSTVVIAFLSSVQTEAQSAGHYGASVASKQLVQSALHLAMGQVSDATKSTKTPGSTAIADRIAWASQPGMIRTWDAEGKGWKVFKLYSSKNMVEDFKNGVYSTTTELANEVPNDWVAKPALFTDLNQPVLVADTAGAITRDTARFRAEYPIIDPLALGVRSDFTDRIEGFSLGVPPGYGGPTSTDPKTSLPQPTITAATDPTFSSQAGKTGNPAPMPVVWIYVLKDGTLTVPSGTSNNGRTATWSGTYAPTAANPIVGRFAFWGDDEACKLNVNTASEPTAWDTPRAASMKDFYNGKYQPQNKEYQRYPGHPAMTALSPVFLPGRTLTPDDREAIYKLIPRVREAGSTSGTVAITGSPAPMAEDTERLFANADEFLFDPARVALATGSVVDPERLKRAGFFLTANSRAPEVNLFGGPRLSLWPVSTGARSPYDSLAAFCTTLGSATSGTAKEYYFQRGIPTANTGANSFTSDYNDIPRNQKLYTYLKSVTGDTFTSVPGFGGSLKTAWGLDRDQVLTEIFDYIRCTNLKDNQPGGSVYTQGGEGQVLPIEIGNTRGFGRIHTISQFGIQFICNKDDETRTSPATTGLPAGDRQIQAAVLFSPFSVSLGWTALYEDLFVEVKFDKDVKIGADILFDSGATKTIRVDDANQNGYHLNVRQRGGCLGFRGIILKNGGGAYPLISRSVTLHGINSSAPTMSFGGLDMTVKLYAGASADPSKLLQTFNVSMPAATLPAPSLVLTGTEAYGGAGTTAASYWWGFGRFGSLGAHPLAPGAEYRDPNRRWGDWGSPPGFKTACMFRAEDVVRSVVPEHGDIRLIATKKIVDKSAFVPIGPSYFDSKMHFSHIFGEICGPHLIYGFGNEPTGSQVAADPAAAIKDRSSGTIAIAQVGDQLTAGLYHWSKFPEIRPGAGKKYNLFGDFDNGIAQSCDGSYINKPDEGNQAQSGSHWPYFQWSYSALNSGYFSPNRLVSSAGMLGSLPTGLMRHTDTNPSAWRTLLFRPQKGHPGDPGYQDPTTAKSPSNKAPDHLVMDLFWMPVVEPYAISEPFSTAGKINMNYEIAPFNYIKRATGLHGVMKSEEPLAVPNDAADVYKLADHETASNLLPDEGARGCVDQTVLQKWIRYVRSGNPSMREPLDIEQTLTQFDKRFKAGEIFRSATQICEVHLVSKGALLSQYEQTVKVNGMDVPKFWNDHVVTGDNARERPYSNLYARLTTKSNVFTVHIRAQVLRKAGSSPATEWNEDRDRMVSEYRGSTVIERYIDAADPTLPDFTTNSTATLDANYRFRQVSTKKFAP